MAKPSIIIHDHGAGATPAGIPAAGNIPAPAAAVPVTAVVAPGPIPAPEAPVVEGGPKKG